MLSLSTRILTNYWAMVVKMTQDSANIEIAKNNYELLCDAKTLLGLTCILPLLELVQGLSKFSQGKQNFIYDSVYAMNLS